jgi:hypothetical protein
MPMELPFMILRDEKKGEKRQDQSSQILGVVYMRWEIVRNNYQT